MKTFLQGETLNATDLNSSLLEAANNVNVAVQWSWTNTQTFSNTITFSGNLYSSNVITANNMTVTAVNTATFTANSTVFKFANNLPVHANGVVGASGTVLTSNGTGVYWATSTSDTITLNGQTAAYQLAATDVGKVVSTNSAVTVNGAVLAAGFNCSIYNNSGLAITLTSGAGATIYIAGTATTGNRTLAQRGVATLLCVAANTFVISGAGLS